MPSYLAVIMLSVYSMVAFEKVWTARISVASKLSLASSSFTVTIYSNVLSNVVCICSLSALIFIFSSTRRSTFEASSVNWTLGSVCNGETVVTGLAVEVAVTWVKVSAGVGSVAVGAHVGLVVSAHE